jgi:hypothetical protein
MISKRVSSVEGNAGTMSRAGLKKKSHPSQVSVTSINSNTSLRRSAPSAN